MGSADDVFFLTLNFVYVVWSTRSSVPRRYRVIKDIRETVESIGLQGQGMTRARQLMIQRLRLIAGGCEYGRRKTGRHEEARVFARFRGRK
jgi:hypothetical protein